MFALFGSRYSGSCSVHYSSQTEVDAGVFFGFTAFLVLSIIRLCTFIAAHNISALQRIDILFQ